MISILENRGVVGSNRKNVEKYIKHITKVYRSIEHTT